MAKSPSQQSRKSIKTPKSVSRKRAPVTDDTVQEKSMPSHQMSSSFASFCTPNRMTRSMARMSTAAMPPPMPNYVTPLKRKTIAVGKDSAKKSALGQTLGRKWKKVENIHQENAKSAASASENETNDTDNETAEVPGKFVLVIGRQSKSKDKEEISDLETSQTDKSGHESTSDDASSGKFVRPLNRKSGRMSKSGRESVGSRKSMTISNDEPANEGQLSENDTSVNGTSFRTATSNVESDENGDGSNTAESDDNIVQPSKPKRSSTTKRRSTFSKSQNSEDVNVSLVKNDDLAECDGAWGGPIVHQLQPKSNRNSTIDLTDSPMPANKSVMNKTFSPEKNDENANSTGVNDKTFSPKPSPKNAANKGLFLTPQVVKPANSLVTKSHGKNATPNLKRLQGTPMNKKIVRNKIGTPRVMSSAKKEKIAEAVADVLINEKKTEKPLIPKIAVNSPKVFKFGTSEDEKEDKPFRFSMVAPRLKSATKAIPDFGKMHNRMFEKTDSLTQNVDRHQQRAKLLLSGKKPAQAKSTIEKPVGKTVAKAIVVKPVQPKMNPVEKANPVAVSRLPLAAANRARLNDEERQERRKQLFKQGSKRLSNGKKKNVNIKGVRLNRRFELMMQKRNATSK